jgi:hypothetical protein
MALLLQSRRYCFEAKMFHSFRSFGCDGRGRNVAYVSRIVTAEDLVEISIIPEIF